MSKFDLQIQQPNQNSDQDLEQYHGLDSAEIQAKFESISWRKQRVLQLQFNGKNTVFKVTNQNSNESLNISLNAYSKTEAFEFKVESNIQLVFPQRELFGLMTRKNKEVFAMKQCTLEQANASLAAFLQQDIKALEVIFLDSKTSAIKDAS